MTSQYMEKEELFIWYYRTLLPKGIPYKDDIILFDNYDIEKKKFYSKSEWRKVDFTPMPFPPAIESYKFPQQLFLVVQKKIKEILFDYYEFGSNVKLVSERFFNFLLESGINKGYEKADLKIANKQNELLTDQKYLALRFGAFDDALFDFDEKTKIKGKHTFGSTYYTFPNLSLRDTSVKQSVFVLQHPSYNNALIIRKSQVNAVINSFYHPDIYKLSDFPFIYDHQFDEELLPLANSYIVKN